MHWFLPMVHTQCICDSTQDNECTKQTSSRRQRTWEQSVGESNWGWCPWSASVGLHDLLMGPKDKRFTRHMAHCFWDICSLGLHMMENLLKMSFEWSDLTTTNNGPWSCSMTVLAPLGWSKLIGMLCCCTTRLSRIQRMWKKFGMSSKWLWATNEQKCPIWGAGKNRNWACEHQIWLIRFVLPWTLNVFPFDWWKFHWFVVCLWHDHHCSRLTMEAHQLSSSVWASLCSAHVGTPLQSHKSRALFFSSEDNPDMSSTELVSNGRLLKEPSSQKKMHEERASKSLSIRNHVTLWPTREIGPTVGIHLSDFSNFILVWFFSLTVTNFIWQNGKKALAFFRIILLVPARHNLVIRHKKCLLTWEPIRKIFDASRLEKDRPFWNRLEPSYKSMAS